MSGISSPRETEAGGEATVVTPTGRVHELKTWPTFYRVVESGQKPFEVRRDDRTFLPGDLLHLREWDRQEGYTGRSCWRIITYLLDLRAPMFDVQGDPPLVVLGLAEAEPAARGSEDA